MSFKSLILCLSVVGLGSSAQAEYYKYTDLMFKSYRELRAEMQKKFAKADLNIDAFTTAEGSDRVERDKMNALREALKFVLSRPDLDSLSVKLLPDVRNPLMQLKMYEETLFTVTRESILTYKNKDLPVVYRATAFFMLENILSEARPNIKSNAYMNRIVKSIADADLEVDKEVRTYRSRNGMFKTRDLSAVAQAILKSK
ncbi:MAG: hypothetical protein R2827_11490 [Bdellovibrionales bacterium]